MPSPSSPPALSLRIDNALCELERLAEAVESWAMAVGLSGQSIFQINLVLDELLTNTISYGYDDDHPHSIEISMILNHGQVQITLRDDARPFDPFVEAQAPDLDSSLEERPIGGLGVYFVKQFMHSVSYAREGHHNVIRLSHSQH